MTFRENRAAGDFWPRWARDYQGRRQASVTRAFWRVYGKAERAAAARAKRRQAKRELLGRDRLPRLVLKLLFKALGLGGL